MTLESRINKNRLQLFATTGIRVAFSITFQN